MRTLLSQRSGTDCLSALLLGSRLSSALGSRHLGLLFAVAARAIPLHDRQPDVKDEHITRVERACCERGGCDTHIARAFEVKQPCLVDAWAQQGECYLSAALAWQHSEMRPQR